MIFARFSAASWYGRPDWIDAFFEMECRSLFADQPPKRSMLTLINAMHER